MIKKKLYKKELRLGLGLGFKQEDGAHDQVQNRLLSIFEIIHS